MNVLIISGSIRSRNENVDYIYKCSLEANNLTEYIEAVNNYQASNKYISNSDILTGAVLVSLRTVGVEVEIFSLINLFSKREKNISYSSIESFDNEIDFTDTLSLDENKLSEFKRKINISHGIVLATPVYFGDRSSVANKLLQLSGFHNLLNGKIFGAVSVGAKRNGGQETAVIYSLYEALNQNALVVGNGPPTSQYGGTAVGGKKGTVINDQWGLETSWETGRRVAHVANLLDKGREQNLGRDVRILIIVAMDDTEQLLYSFLINYIKKINEKVANVTFHLENVLDSTIYRCLGCDQCPPDGALPTDQGPTKANHPNCIIDKQDDAMSNIHNLFLESDGIVIAGLNVKRYDQLLYRYQALIERTRYIRRDNFELTNKVFASFTLNQVGARINSLHSLKTLTSYIRHNTIFHKPIEAFIYNGEVIDDGIEDIVQFVKMTRHITAGKKIVEPENTEYVTTGIGGY